MTLSKKWHGTVRMRLIKSIDYRSELTGRFFAFVAATSAGVVAAEVFEVVSEALLAVFPVPLVVVVADVEVELEEEVDDALLVDVVFVTVTVEPSSCVTSEVSTTSEASSESTGTLLDSPAAPSAAIAPKARHPASRSNVDSFLIFSSSHDVCFEFNN